MRSAGTVDTNPTNRFSSSVNLCTWHKKSWPGFKKSVVYKKKIGRDRIHWFLEILVKVEKNWLNFNFSP
jgi:hypothetical protein